MTHLDYQPGLIFSYIEGTYVVTKLNNDNTYDYFFNGSDGFIFKQDGTCYFDERDQLLSSIFVGEL